MKAFRLRIRSGGQKVTHRSLMAKTAYGFAWVFAWRLATRLMGLGSTLILVRMLAPAEFGVVAIAMSFIQSIDQFSQIGVEEALVRMPQPGRAVYDTAFTMIALRCVLIAMIAAAAAWPVASFFDQPSLQPIMLAVAGITLIAGFENIGMQDLRRDMRFDQEFLYQALPRLAGVGATIASALILRDFWALIIGNAVTRVLRVTMSYAMHPMRPRLTLTAWRDLVGFSLWTWAICVARIIRDQPTTFILGRVLGAAPVGMLAVSGEIAQLPATEIVLPMGRSMFSAFALARRSEEDVEGIFRRLLAATAMLTTPASIGLALVADPLMRLTLGPAWMDAVPLMQLIALGSAFAVFGHACHAQFDAFGLLRQDFMVILASALLRTIALAVLAPTYGLIGATAGIALAIITESLLYQIMKARCLPYSSVALLRAVIRPFLGAGVMTAVLLLSHVAQTTSGDATLSAALRLVASVALGAASFIGSVAILWMLAGRPAGPEADLLCLLKRVGGSAAVTTG